MYAAFFGLSHPPFSIAPDPRYLFMSERHREALAHLLYGAESGGGFVLLTGEIGAGKTTVCRHFLEQLPEKVRVAYIFNPQLTVVDLLQTICHEFGVHVYHESPGPATIKEHIDPLNTHLLQCHARGEHNLLIIDEAQGLAVEVLEQLRLLTNLETDQRKLLQIVLIGQPELRQILARPELEQLAQRVIARFHLGALSESETAQYVAHRMGVAGWQGELPFASGALKWVHQLTRGVPRRINVLCDRALLGAYAGSARNITPAIVRRAAAEVFEGGGLQPSVTPTRRKGLLTGLVSGLLLAALVALVWSAAPSLLPVTTGTNSAGRVDAFAAKEQVPAPQPGQLPHNPEYPAVPAAPPPKPAEIRDIDQFLLGMPPPTAWMAKEDLAFSALAPLWGATLNWEQPCADAEKTGLQCYRTNRMSLHGLRKLDRPAALKLSVPGQGSGYLLLTGVAGDAVELRDDQQRRWHTPISALNDAWQGYYATLWRTPPGQQGRFNNGFQRPAAPWMATQLDGMQTRGLLPATAETLKEKVEAFQRAQGIEVNGIAGPTTLMLINRASGIDEPRLLVHKIE